MMSGKKFPVITGLQVVTSLIILLVSLLLPRVLFLENGSREVLVGKEGDVPSLSGTDYYKWKSNSPYTVVNYFSLDCPHCLKLDKIENEKRFLYKEHFSLVYRHSPLTDIQIYSGGKAVISECVRSDSGTEKMFLFITDIYENYRGEEDNYWVEEIAKKYVEDKKKLQGCINSEEVKDLIIKKRKEALSYNINGTPTLIIFKDGVQIARFDRTTASIAKKIMDSVVAQNK